VAVVAAASGVAGWLAETAPTGVMGFDDALCGLAAVLATVLAARAGAWAVVVGSVAVAVGTVGGSPVVAVPAGLAAGMAVGAAVTDRGPADLRAVLGGVLAACAFHLTWPASGTATALLASVAVAVPALSGAARLPRRRRRALVRAGAVVITLAGAATALGAVAALSARRELEAGAERAQTGLAAARRGEVVKGSRALEAASAAFAAARSDLEAWWARPARLVPVVAHQSRALATLASTGAEIAEVGARLAEVSEPTGFRITGGAVPLERIRALVGPGRAAADVLGRKGAELEQAGEPWLAPPVRREVDRLVPRIRQAGRDAAVATRTAELAPALLGADGPRRWFVAVQSPAELRATGGFIGSFAELAADGGRLQLSRVGRTAELNNGGTGGGRRIDGPPDYLARYGRFDPHLLWQNVNMSPDFPTVAGVISGLYPQSGGPPVDGVVALDPYGLAALLRAVGPVRVPEWPEPITADSAPRVLLHDQYVRFPQTTERVDFLGNVTQAVWQRVLGGSVGIVDLGRALVEALDEKHVVLAGTRADEQRTLGDLGVSGAVAPVADDFLAVVTQNAGGNKIDWFLRRAVDYRVRLHERSGAVDATVRVTLRNEAPATGLPDYVIGSARRPPPPAGTNSTFLSVYSPWGLQGATLDGRPVGFESARELGRNVYSAFVDVPPGGTAVVELTLTGSRGQRQGPYLLALHRQPAVAPDEVRITVGGRVQQVALRRDHVLTFDP
jgi:hypothetical protein